MANFLYKAYTTGGTVSSGTIAADDVNAAIDALYGAGLTPFETQRLAGDGGELSPAAATGAPVPRLVACGSGGHPSGR